MTSISVPQKFLSRLNQRRISGYLNFRDIQTGHGFRVFLFPGISAKSSDPAENNAPFVHRCFVGTLPLREKRSGYSAFCCAMACKKQVPAFFKVLFYSDVHKASPQSGRSVTERQK